MMDQYSVSQYPVLPPPVIDVDPGLALTGWQYTFVNKLDEVNSKLDILLDRTADQKIPIKKEKKIDGRGRKYPPQKIMQARTMYDNMGLPAVLVGKVLGITITKSNGYSSCNAVTEWKRREWHSYPAAPLDECAKLVNDYYTQQGVNNNGTV